MAAIENARILILLVGICVMLLLRLSYSSDADADAHDHATARLWKRMLPSADLPANLAHRFSELSSTSVSRFATYLEDGSLAQHSSEFCHAAGIMCRDGDKSLFQPSQIYRPWLPSKWRSSNMNDDTAPHLSNERIKEMQMKHVFFREKELIEGGKLFVNSLLNSVPPRPFLPKAIASRLPFSTRTLPDLTHMLRVPSNSYMSEAMAVSLKDCETERIGERIMCATSVEYMLQFVVSVLGPTNADRIQVISTDVGTSTFPQIATFQQVSVKVQPDQKKVIICHDIAFPYALYFCHEIAKTKVYEAAWTTTEQEGKAVVRAAAVCHMETRKFDASHEAFAVLNMKPGEGEVCHWIDDGNLLMHVGSIG